MHTNLEQATGPPPEALAYQQKIESALAERKAVMTKLLGTDYEYAQDKGWLDAFYVDPETGEDGLLHVLTGAVATGPGGARIPTGFHHEPSSLDPRTFVDRSHLEGANDTRRRDYRRFDFEPYKGRVEIMGLKKVIARRNDSGEVELVPSHSNMFPLEYDALTVMSSIVRARDNRDTSKDVLNPEAQRIITEGSAIMLDGETEMKIRMVLDARTQKIISAFPTAYSRKGFMNLSKDDQRRHLGLQ